MARRAKLLNQLAHLQLLQRCAASWRRGRALIRIIADALRKSEAPTPPTAAVVDVAVHPASTKQGFVSPLSNYSRSLARSLGNPQIDYDRLDNKQPHPKTPARPHQPTQDPTHFVAKPILTNTNVNTIGALSKREAVT